MKSCDKVAYCCLEVLFLYNAYCFKYYFSKIVCIIQYILSKWQVSILFQTQIIAFSLVFDGIFLLSLTVAQDFAYKVKAIRH